jgi:hypothetical protein
VHQLYFRITDAPDEAAFDRHWVELSPTPFVVDRDVVRSEDVSRSGERCVLLRPDADEPFWELRNRAPHRMLIAYSGEQRYELRRDMSVLLRGPRWTGTLTDAYSFELTARRPGGIVAPAAGPTDTDHPARTRRRRERDARAADYLDRHRDKRLVLAYQWRQHIGHTRDVAEDLTTADVGRAFGIPDKTVSAYRSALAEYVYRETGHQQAIRDLVVGGGLLTWADVVDADREVRDRAGGAT